MNLGAMNDGPYTGWSLFLKRKIRSDSYFFLKNIAHEYDQKA
jgi:hypothetical protein